MNLWVVNGGDWSRDARKDWQGGIGGGVQGVSSQPRGSWSVARVKGDGGL